MQWKQHALQRMIQRGISRHDVRGAMSAGEVIEDYPDDEPYPSALVLGFVSDRPLHVVVALHPEAEYAYVITAYEPHPDRFGPDFRTRR